MFRKALRLQEQLSDWREQLFKYEKDLKEMSGMMGEFKKDTVLRAIINDSAFKSLHANEIQDLKDKWRLG